MNTKLDDIYIKELHTLYDMERQLADALPDFAETATSPDLIEAITDHLEETKDHKTRLEVILNRHNENAGDGHTSAALAELISHAQNVSNDITGKHTRDVFITASLRKIEKLEKANYQNLIEWADIMDPPEDVYDADKTNLKETLNEKDSAVGELYNLAEGGPSTSGLNTKAHK